MALSGSGSFLANSAQRRTALNKVRSGLLDRPGIARRGGPPPPTVPAQDKQSPQQKSLAATGVLKGREQEGQPLEQPVPEEQAVNPLGLDEESKQELMNQIEPFLARMKQDKRAKLHRKIGRTRKFFGGGV